MNEKTPIIGTGFTALFAAGWLDQANQILLFIGGLLTMAWWIRRWWQDPNTPPPDLSQPKPTPKKPPGTGGTVAQALLGFGLLFLWMLSAGCASYSTDQRDIRTVLPSGDTRNEITTKVHVYTLWSSKSALANSKASQTDKTQGASLGSLTQEATGADTIKAITELLKTAKPVP